MQNPIEYAPLLSKLAHDEAQRKATLSAVEDAVEAGLVSSDTFEALTEQMNADRARAFQALMRSLISGTAARPDATRWAA